MHRTPQITISVGLACETKLHHVHGAVQSVVCRQDLTLKPLVALLYIVVCPVICFEGIELL